MAHLHLPLPPCNNCSRTGALQHNCQRAYRSWQDVLAARSMISWKHPHASKLPTSHVQGNGRHLRSLPVLGAGAGPGAGVHRGLPHAAAQHDLHGISDGPAPADAPVLEPWLKEGPASAVDMKTRVQYAQVVRGCFCTVVCCCKHVLTQIHCMTAPFMLLGSAA